MHRRKKEWFFFTIGGSVEVTLLIGVVFASIELDYYKLVPARRKQCRQV